jgi:hypothetical protein
MMLRIDLRQLNRGRILRTMPVMRTSVVVLAVLLGCAPTQRNKRIVSDFIFVASTTLTACDLGQSISVSEAGYQGQLREGNMLLGERPSSSTLVAYNAGVIAANAVAYKTTPERWRFAAPLVLGLVEMVVVMGNALVVPRPLCGVR